MRVMGEFEGLKIGERGCFKMELSIVLEQVAQHSVLANRELMAVGKRKKIVVGIKNSRLGRFGHNGKVAGRSIYKGLSTKAQALFVFEQLVAGTNNPRHTDKGRDGSWLRRINDLQ